MRALLLASVVAAAWTSAACASIITYAVNGTFSDGKVLGGSFTVDNSKIEFGQFSAVDVTVTGFSDFTRVAGLGQALAANPYPNQYSITFTTDFITSVQLVFDANHTDFTLNSIPNENLVVPSTGRGSSFSAYYSGPSTSVALTVGTIAAVTPVPEPTSLALLGLALAGIAGARRRRTA